jgi:hypothetical protein
MNIEMDKLIYKKNMLLKRKRLKIYKRLLRQFKKKLKKLMKMLKMSPMILKMMNSEVDGKILILKFSQKLAQLFQIPQNLNQK